MCSCSVAGMPELDSLQVLAHNAVHAAFAGYTGVTMGLVNTHYVVLPIPVVISSPRRVRHVPPDLCARSTRRARD